MSLKDKRRIYIRFHSFKKTNTYQKFLRHSPTVGPIIGLKKIMPLNVVCSKAFFIIVSAIVTALIMIFMISSDTVKICVEKHKRWVQV